MTYLAQTASGSIELPDELIDAAIRCGFLQADLAAAWLKSKGFPRKDQPDCIALQPAFLLELGAILHIRQWEGNGLRELINVDLPSAAEAIAEMVHRLQTNPVSYLGDDIPDLSKRITEVYTANLSWAGPTLFQADLVVGEIDEDQLVDVIAELLWAHRNTLPHAAITNMER